MSRLNGFFSIARGLGVIVSLSFLTNSSSFADENFIKFKVSDKRVISKLSQIISIDKVLNDGTTFAYANDKELLKFKALNLPFEKLLNPSLNFRTPPQMAVRSRAGDAIKWDAYPTYDEYVRIMMDFEKKFPSMCKLYNLGNSTKGRKILALKITKNADKESTKPEFFYSSTMHGDEVTGMMMLLRLSDYLLNNSSRDAKVNALLENVEIWLNPLTNPDGTYARGNNTVMGATRANGNSIDINRNFPDPRLGAHGDGNQYQPETIAMMNFFNSRHFVSFANFHGGAEVINYPWDTFSKRHADDNWFQAISKAYVDAVHAKFPKYMDDINNGITNGSDWYVIGGGMQDYSNFNAHVKSVTFEVSTTKLPDPKTMPKYWEMSKEPMLDFIINSVKGLHGSVVDSQTKKPIKAKIEILNHDVDGSFVESDATYGDYHRPLLPGNYNLKISANGYKDKLITVNYTGGDLIQNIALDSSRRF